LLVTRVSSYDCHGDLKPLPIPPLRDPAPVPQDATFREGRLLLRYLLREEPKPELVARYAAGVRERFAGEPEAATPKLEEFALRHSWSLPFLDAAAGLLRPASTLRRKLLLAAAVGETHPAYVGRFATCHYAATSLLVRLVFTGVMAMGKLVIGLVILPFAEWRQGG
jgi:hypothetical protein